MIPGAILLIVLLFALVIFIIWAIGVVRNAERRMQDKMDVAMNEHAKAIVKISDYERDRSDMQYEIKRLRAWSKMPDEFRF